MPLEIEHITHLAIRGLNLHVAEVGESDLGTVVFLYGFQDWRGYGLSDQPPEHEEASFDDLVADVIAILDALDVPKAFLVAKDFGARPAYAFALQHPDRTRGVVSLGAPYSPGPMSFLDAMPDGFYILRWREPRRAEADFSRYDVRRVLRTIYVLFAGAEIPVAKEGQDIMHLADLSTPLPEWFTEEDLDGNGGTKGASGGHGTPKKIFNLCSALIPYRPSWDFFWFHHAYVKLFDKSLRLQVPRVGGRVAGWRHGQLHAGPQDRLHPGGEPPSHLVQEQFPEQVKFLRDHPVAA
ncbi:hypothetical protein BS78_01G187800 [Paspalum vaginatum]|nr:hypothetical protein BS78_01G187800 [Paspalum vaginatum]